jgi:probable rRNA maturation factor
MAKENASLYGTSLSKELSLYVIHGILHLLGYSDISGRQRKIMHKKQEQLLKYF